VNLFAESNAAVKLGETTVRLEQRTRYPWDGHIEIAVTPAQPATFALKVRVPGWARNQPVPTDLYRYDDGLQPQVTLVVNGQPIAIEQEKGYATIRRRWQPGDVATLDLPMPVRRIVANPKVEADAGRFAVQRGPLVYCAEGADNDGNVLEKSPGAKATLAVKERPDLLGGIVQITAAPQDGGETMTLIPYYAWCHRGPNQMAVWLTDWPRTAPPPPPMTTAGRARASASFCNPSDSVAALNDRIDPPNSHDLGVHRHTFWNHLGGEEWLQYDWDEPVRIGAVEVYWFDDRATGGCYVPASWRLLYRDGDQWKPVTSVSTYGTSVDKFNRVTFDPVTTGGLRIELKLQDGRSAGVLEWRVEEAHSRKSK
jgi:hypothetical protein